MRLQSDLNCAVFFAALCASSLCVLGMAQETAPPGQAASTTGPILRVTTREAVLDVIARDQNRNPVTDLNENDFQVFELGKHADKTPRQIHSLKVIDPHKDASRAGAELGGFRISSGAICALNATVHYEFAIQAAQEPGYHQVLVKTTRQGVTLSYRRHYYVGEASAASAADSKPTKERKSSSDSMALSEAACYHATFPPTLALTARAVAVAGSQATRYVVVIKPDSFPNIGLDGVNTRVQLDFGMCTFDAIGQFGQYLHSALERQLTPEELARVQVHGLGQLLEIPGAEPPYLARLVVRDRATNNLGVVDVARPVTPEAVKADKNKLLRSPTGSARVFGSITPRAGTFCGDVYELSSGSSMLPDFWNLDPVASIYADSLSVWDQDLDAAQGIPGATKTNMYFGIDYYGEFYISKPGEYVFDQQSDDGSKLEIDNQQLLDIDGLHPVQAKTVHVKLDVGLHTIHIPYFQGTPTRLAMVLQIKPPGESMKVFNITDYAPPKTTPVTTASEDKKAPAQ